VKHVLIRNTRIVVGRHITEVTKASTYSSAASLTNMRMIMILAELDGLELCAGRPWQYLEAYT